ncbi:SRPBCC family protein [Halostreptopolyspora alba]|uniref:SRPBCC family protein n=1 Tax=Halostreptopolyspora alba TaxID=2487137 RepID=A0A3N0E4A3_9ACTN|nr:SRPBCC family protein [Nocardiopsaceae bacterium YIM 96095]
MPTSNPITVEVESRIEAAPERVWELASDITVPARFSGELQRVEWNDGATQPHVGARFTGHNSNPRIGEWSTTSEVVEVAAPHSFVWQVLGPEEPVATWRFDLVPESLETTLLRHRVRTGPGHTPLDEFIANNPEKKDKALRAREEALRTNMRATVDGIREVCEGEAPFRR